MMIDFLPRCLGSLSDGTADFCSEDMPASNIKEFWKKTELPSGGDDSHVCADVKATKWFMPEKTLSEKGLSGGGSMVEMPVTQTREETEQIANTHVEHVVNTFEVEMPKIIKQTMQKLVIQEKINQMTKHIDVPPLQFTDKIVDIPVVAQRQVHVHRKIQKTIEISQSQYTDDQVVDVPVVLVVQSPLVHVVAETAEIPQLLSDVRGVVQNIRIDSFIDEFSSVDSRRLSHQDCEGLFHVGKQSPDIAGGVHVDRDDLHVMLAAEGTQQPHRSKQHHGNQQQQATNNQRQQAGQTEEEEKENEEEEKKGKG